MEASGTPAAASKKPPARSRSRKTATSDYRVAELYFERRGNRSIVGNIYKGRVDNVLPGLEAAFVDIGLEKNGFLHVDEIVLPGVEVQRRGRGGGPGGTHPSQPRPGGRVRGGQDPPESQGGGPGLGGFDAP